MKAVLKVGENAHHEFDLYHHDRVIDEITTFPWTNITGTFNTGGQDRVSTKLL
jgi:hypothetical protein